MPGDESAANAPGRADEPEHTQAPTPPDSPKKKRDRWDKIEILGRPLAAFLTALTIALLGWFGQGVLLDQQQQETRRALFTELLSKREDAESALRKDMFNTIMSEFFEAEGRPPGQVNISQRLLKLEMLALNFGESLSLNPLFIEIDNDIEGLSNGDSELGFLDRDDFRARLHSLARRVSGRQIAALAPGGRLFEFDVPISEAVEGNTYRWPDGVIPADPSNMTEDERAMLKAELSDIELDEVKRTYSATFSHADRRRKTVLVHLEIQSWNPDNEQAVPETTEMDFELNFFNFPMIDNTRLSRNQRFGFVMESFGDKSIHVIGICFRGMYSSQRDKPFLDEVIYQLNSNAMQNQSGASEPAQ